jgi:signal transduction histidine kinase
VSLRRRVLVSSLLVLLLTLALVTVAADLLFGAQTVRDLTNQLRDRATLADQLVRQGVTDRQLVARLENGGIRARLTLPDGTALGSADPPPNGTVLRPGARRIEDALTITRALPGRRTITLTADTTAVSAARARLRRVLLIVGLSALVVTALVLLATVRAALSPLDAMTSMARSIARGDRGRRLAPVRTDTELGRTAVAFDDMLDALEGAEASAEAAAERTRQFVADAAHELRTPIAGVQAAAEAVIAAGPDGDTAQRDRLHLLLIREARRAGRLVADLLSLARIDAGVELHTGPADLYAIAAGEVERTRLLAPDLSVELVGAPVTVRADAQRIAQILANLLNNARRHTPPGGRIEVRCGTDRGWAVVGVSDSGPGVPPADRERIFDRLVRLDDARTADLPPVPDAAAPPQSGAGLGLAIARGLARAHGGDLRCDPPTTLPGATFTLHLPLAPTPS